MSLIDDFQLSRKEKTISSLSLSSFIRESLQAPSVKQSSHFDDID